MKALLFLILISLFSASAYSQNPVQIQISSQIIGFGIFEATLSKPALPNEEKKLPAVTTKDGETVYIRVCREYIYPTEFDSYNVPTKWETADLGVTCCITPYIQNKKISFNGSIRLVEAPSLKLGEKEMVPVISSFKVFSRTSPSGIPIEIETLTPHGKKASLILDLQLIDERGQPIIQK